MPPVPDNGQHAPEPPVPRSGWTRRRFLKAAGAAAAAAVVAGATDAFAIEPRWVTLTRPVIPLAGLDEQWDGATIALLADLHVGRWVSVGYVRRVVEMANDARPDIVALVGDCVSRRDAVSDELGSALSRLAAPEGKFAVLGNHDYWTDAAAVAAMLTAAGFVLLTNAHRILSRPGGRWVGQDGPGRRVGEDGTWPRVREDGSAGRSGEPGAGGRARDVPSGRLCIAGVDDLWAGRPDLPAALSGADDRVPRLLLCHNPDYAEDLPARPRVDLMLCGHSHGGQVNLPLLGRPALPIRHARYAAGLADGPRCRVYTSVGLGMIGVPVRFNCRPELTVLTLRRGAPATPATDTWTSTTAWPSRPFARP